MIAKLKEVYRDGILFLYVDLFCGAGGTSTGVEKATVKGMKIAKVIACVNHDKNAIASHSANHPDAKHYTEDIRTLDISKVFFYVDPPYPKEVRASFNDYKFEFTNQDHIDLAEQLRSIEGLAMVSSYDSKFYDELYGGWNKVKLPVKRNNIRSSGVQEVIYMNYNIQKRGLFY
jgi:site-specific DNA-adenine methylase